LTQSAIEKGERKEKEPLTGKKGSVSLYVSARWCGDERWRECGLYFDDDPAAPPHDFDVGETEPEIVAKRVQEMKVCDWAFFRAPQLTALHPESVLSF
jgi:hypothetical protein